MFGFLKKLFGGIDPELAEQVKKAGTIIDVRTVLEFERGHVDGSVNIPLDQIDLHLEDIRKMKKPIATCCRSGRRSGIAADKLNHHGIDSFNGGGWKSVVAMLKS